MGEVVSEVGGVDAKARAGLAVEEGKKWGGSLLSGFVKGVGQVDLEKLGWFQSLSLFVLSIDTDWIDGSEHRP